MNSPSPEDSAWQTRHRYFPAVEGMRGVAALSVLSGHTLFLGNAFSGRLQGIAFWLAIAGVGVFFSISGFLLYRPFVAARNSGRSVVEAAPSYLWRRAVRIFPAYWVALTFLAIWPGLIAVFSSQWWAYYGLLQIYSSAWTIGGITPAWTLSVEVSFYLLLPVLAVVLARRGARPDRPKGLRWEVGVLGGLALLSCSAYWWTGTHAGTGFLEATLVGTFSWFWWGMLLAVIQVAHPPAISRLARILAQPLVCWPLAVAVFALLPSNFFAHLGFSDLLRMSCCWACIGLIGGLLVAPAALGDSKRLVRALLANRVLVYAGTISYGIYLYHYPILNWALSTHLAQTAARPAATGGLITLALAVALGSASWFGVERPLMRRVRSVKAEERNPVRHPPRPEPGAAEPVASEAAP
jgi:peptidoglycan/LPS O-acetylase OafA/YrhL